MQKKTSASGVFITLQAFQWYQLQVAQLANPFNGSYQFEILRLHILRFEYFVHLKDTWLYLSCDNKKIDITCVNNNLPVLVYDQGYCT